MKKNVIKSKVEGRESSVHKRRAIAGLSTLDPRPSTTAFTLIEVMVVVALLALMIVALMAVFSNTQRAFRANLTQTDVLESGRMTMDLIRGDLEAMAPSFGRSNVVFFGSPTNDINFSVALTELASPPSPLIQPLVGGNQQRTNLLETFFILSRGNIGGSPSWIGTGYLVNSNSPDGALYPLYRFYMVTNMMTGTPASLYNAYVSTPATNATVWSHLLDGVVDLTVRAFDLNGVWMTNGYGFGQSNTLKNAEFLAPEFGEVPFYMFSNSLPASVEIEMGVLEDRALEHAESLNGALQTGYLQKQSGAVHLFRQRATIRNVDPSAYQ